jgi:hypothetical protein
MGGQRWLAALVCVGIVTLAVVRNQTKQPIIGLYSHMACLFEVVPNGGPSVSLAACL